MKKLMTVIATAFLGAAQAGAWPIAECGSEQATAWAAYESSVRAAKPGSPLYLPKPFPKTRAEILKDYLYQYHSIWSDTPSDQLPPDELPVFQSIQQNSVRFEIVPVENWTTMRCNRQQKDASYNLIRIFDSESGAELARTALSASGFILVTVNATEEQRSEPLAKQQGRLMKLDAALAKAKGEFKVTGTGAQYVSTFGTLRCRPFAPCIAFRNGADSYIFSSEGELFRLGANGRRLALGKDMKSPEAATAVLQSLGATERLMSLGGQALGVVQRVAPASVE